MFLLVLIPTVSAFATSDDTDVSCSPVTGKCGKTNTDCNTISCTVVTAPECSLFCHI